MTEDLQLPLEIRVHGVGGPQAAKMLGEVSEHEVVTVPAFPIPAFDADGHQLRLPKDSETRFAQRLAGVRVEAYEWGGLTAASLTKALWVLYLPFTLINAGGWAHAANRTTESTGDGGRRVKVRTSVRLHHVLTHAAALLATITYVGWLSYIALDLVAVEWVDHVRATDTPTGLTRDITLVMAPRIAPVLLILVVGTLFSAPVLKGRFEDVRDADDNLDRNAAWPAVPSVGSLGFFAHEGSYRRLLRGHLAVALAAVLVALSAYVVGTHRIGLVLLVLAVVQVLVIGCLVLTDAVGRWWRRPSEVFEDELITDQNLDDRGARMPVGAAFVALGTAMAHIAFAGLAMTLAPFLARWPKETGGDRLEVGPELDAADVLAWAVVLLGVLGVAVVLANARRRIERTAAGTAKPSLTVCAARQTTRLAAVGIVALSVPTAVFIVTNFVDVLDDGLVSWYDGYEPAPDAIVKRAGSFLLLAFPGVIYAVLSRKHESGFARVVGNVWDVLTFWPRRFHPYGAPCSAERSVPELRARLRYVFRYSPGERHGIVVVGHSQGSVLAAAAIASLRAHDGTPGLVTFGSPLGTLYAPTWPSYIPPLVAEVRSRVDTNAPDLPWVNFWRSTDPVGAAVPGATNVQLLEPQAPRVSIDQAIRLRPLERPTRWGTVVGHNLYLADEQVQEAIAERRADRAGGP